MLSPIPARLDVRFVTPLARLRMFSGVQPLAVWPRSLTAYVRIVRGRSRTPARAVTCAQAARHRRGCRGRCRWWSWWPSRLLRAPSSIRLGPYWARDSHSPPKYGFDHHRQGGDAVAQLTNRGDLTSVRGEYSWPPARRSHDRHRGEQHDR